MAHDIHIIGGGLAGCEAAWQLAQRGLRVRLSEMRGAKSGGGTAAHQTDTLAELVCSNSFRSDDDERNAVGLLHHEMRRLGSLVMQAGEAARVPAGSAFAVDREVFAAEVQRALEAHPNVSIVREVVHTLPESGPTIVATGPLTGSALAESITRVTGTDRLHFFDAIAPIVHRDSIDMGVCWMQSRWNKGESEGDKAAYINCPMDKAQYLAFHQGLVEGDKTVFKEWEANTPYFDGCMPIEVMAERGVDTLRYGPMKPVGLDNPRDTTPEFPQGRWPYAVVQLRQDNALGTLWNMVGFQTKLKHAEQVRLFRTIPGLEKAEFARLGGLHRNTFINSPALLDRQLRGERLGRTARRADGGRGARRGALDPAAADQRDGRLAGTHHRRCAGGQFPAHERELRPVPATSRGGQESAQGGLHQARQGGFRRLAGRAAGSAGLSRLSVAPACGNRPWSPPG
jgi:methylenetetrahydrofolate--tRNA-(uracil-5-)-methyltransferase